MPSRDHLPSIMDSILMGLEELIPNEDKEATEELERMLAGTAKEAGNGVAWTGPRVVVIGQKA